eukprot:gb/GEZN01004891.1/.p1 GENE.gb/GEZN01004891.1/~~gb/GEZN01004891.1/.p1  ORF type:complete len:383 (-),score=77.87 gb/GEZN01004891.1/:176-1324(-)
MSPEDVELALQYEASQQPIPYMKLPIQLLVSAAPGSPIRQLGEGRRLFVEAFKTDWIAEPLLACKLFAMSIITHPKAGHASPNRYHNIVELCKETERRFFSPTSVEKFDRSMVKYFYILRAHAFANWTPDLSKCDESVRGALEQKNVEKEEVCYLHVIRGQMFFHKAREIAEETQGKHPDVKVFLKRAIKDYTLAIEACPQNTLAYVRLASAHAFEGAGDEVQKAYEQYFQHANDEDENMANICYLYCGHKAALLENRRKTPFRKLPVKLQHFWAKQTQQYYMKGQTLMEAGFWGRLNGEAYEVLKRVEENMEVVQQSGFEIEKLEMQGKANIGSGGGEEEAGKKKKKKNKKKKKKKKSTTGEGEGKKEEDPVEGEEEEDEE